MYLPAGRYSCAQALKARDLHFLEGRSLGEVCHIVQLSVSQKKVIGYLNGAIVPYAKSQSKVKEQCAVSQQAYVNSTGQAADAANGSAGLGMATWEVARKYLKEILD